MACFSLASTIAYRTRQLCTCHFFFWIRCPIKQQSFDRLAFECRRVLNTPLLFCLIEKHVHRSKITVSLLAGMISASKVRCPRVDDQPSKKHRRLIILNVNSVLLSQGRVWLIFFSLRAWRAFIAHKENVPLLRETNQTKKKRWTWCKLEENKSQRGSSEILIANMRFSYLRTARFKTHTQSPCNLSSIINMKNNGPVFQNHSSRPSFMWKLLFTLSHIQRSAGLRPAYWRHFKKYNWFSFHVFYFLNALKWSGNKVSFDSFV